MSPLRSSSCLAVAVLSILGGCKGETVVKDNPEVVSRLQACAEKAKSKDDLIASYEAEIARLKLEVPPFPDLVEALRFDPEGRRPPAISDLYAAIVDLWFLAEADHPGAQALLAEVALLKDRTALAPGYALFLIERATWKGHRIANVDELRRRAAANLPEDAIAELTALAARPEANYSDWLLARRKAGTLPE